MLALLALLSLANDPSGALDPLELRNHKLNGDLQPEGTLAGDVDGFRLTPDGERLIYLADGDSDDVGELYSRALGTGGDVVKLNGPMAGTGILRVAPCADGVCGAYVTSPDGTWVVYVADELERGVFELFRVRADGADGPLRLSAGPEGEDIVASQLQVTPDGQRVLYLQSSGGEHRDLYSVRLDGTEPPVRLNPDLSSGGGVTVVRTSPDGGRVVYRADQTFDEQFELFSVPVSGGAATKLNSFDPDFSFVSTDFDTTSIEGTVVYRESGLRRVPIDGSGPSIKFNQYGSPDSFRVSSDGELILYKQATTIRVVPAAGGIDPTILVSGSINAYDFAPDEESIVYARFVSVGERYLYRLGLEPDAEPILLSNPSEPYGDVLDFAFVPGSEQVVYSDRTAGSIQLLRTDLSGDFEPVDISGGLDWLTVTGFAISPTGDRAVFGARTLETNVPELFSVNLDGVPLPRRINSELPEGGVVHLPHFAIDPPGRHVVYRAQEDVVGISEVYGVDVDGDFEPVPLNDRLVVTGTGDIEGQFRFSPNSETVVYRADGVTDGVFELFAAPVKKDGPALRLNHDFEEGEAIAIAPWPSISPDSRWVVYTSQNLDPWKYAHYSVPIDRSFEPVQLTEPLGPWGDIGPPTIDPSSRFVVYTSGPTVYEHSLLSKPIDGSGPPVELGVPPEAWVWEREFVPGQGSVVYKTVSSWPNPASFGELHMARLDGTGDVIQLSDPDLYVGDWELGPDAGSVFYMAGGRLFRTTLDERADTVEIELPDEFDFVHDVEPILDGEGLLLATAMTSGSRKLYTLPVDGSAPPLLLTGDLFVDDIEFAASHATDRAVFIASVINLPDRFYSVPLDGSTESVQIGADAEVRSLFLGTDDRYVVFEPATSGRDLFTVPADGSSEPVEITSPEAKTSAFREFSPDGRWVAFTSEMPGGEIYLFAAPVDGSQAGGRLDQGGGVSLHPPGPIPFLVWPIVGFTPDGRRLAYLSDQQTAFSSELFATTLSVPQGD